jgi:hypothetical protein
MLYLDFFSSKHFLTEIKTCKICPWYSFCESPYMPKKLQIQIDPKIRDKKTSRNFTQNLTSQFCTKYLNNFFMNLYLTQLSFLRNLRLKLIRKIGSRNHRYVKLQHSSGFLSTSNVSLASFQIRVKPRV